MLESPQRGACCPLCSRDNACGLATPGATGCWCFGERVPRSLLSQVPTEQRDRACICQRCVRSHRGQAGGVVKRLRELLAQIRRGR